MSGEPKRIEVQGIPWNILGCASFDEDSFVAWLEDLQDKGVYSKKLDGKRIWKTLEAEMVKRGYKDAPKEAEPKQEAEPEVEEEEEKEPKPKAKKKAKKSKGGE